MALDFDASSLRARPAKRSRLEADRRRDMLQRVANKFADIDFTKYQYLHARTTDAAETARSGRGRIVPVKPVPTALVENWRHLESYECDGDKSYSEEQFLMLHSRAGHHRRYYTGPFGCLNLTAWGDRADSCACSKAQRPPPAKTRTMQT